MKLVDIVGIVRFSVVSTTSNWFAEWREKQPTFEAWCETIFAEERMRRRFELFENVTMPSLLSQKSDGFRAHILGSTLLPQQWADRLSEVTGRHEDYFRVHYLAPDKLEPGDYGKPIISDLDTTRPFASFRLDDDDALASNYVTRLRRHLRPAKFSHGVSLCRGFEVSVSPTGDSCGLIRRRWPNHSAGLAFVSGPKRPRTIFDIGIGHLKFHHSVPVITDGRRTAYAYFLHGGNSVGGATDEQQRPLNSEAAERTLRDAGIFTNLSNLAKLWSASKEPA